MNFIMDFNKDIRTEWKKQSVRISSHTGPNASYTVLPTSTTQRINPQSIDIYNFPKKTKSLLERGRELKKLTKLFELIQLKHWVSLSFKESKDLFVSEEFKRFHKVQFDIFPLTMDVNKLFTDLKQLLQLENMTIICKIDQEKTCQELVNMLQYILILKNKNYPGIVLFEEIK